jgi:hypothetical protein
MAPPSTGTARRTAAAPQRRPSTRRTPLRVFEPEPRRSPRRKRSRNFHVWLSVTIVVASLLVVVIGDAMVAQGQVRMANTQMAIAAAQDNQKSMQVEVAQLSAAPRLVAKALADGQVATGSVQDLPYTSLEVPLPAPLTKPISSAATSPTTDTPPATAR